MCRRVFILLLVVVMFTAGCKSTTPNLRPDRGNDRIAEPPAGRESPEYPRESFDSAIYPAKPPTAVNRDAVPTSGFGSLSGSRTGPYKY